MINEDKDLLDGAMKVAMEQMSDEQRAAVEEEMAKRQEEAEKEREASLNSIGTVLKTYRDEAVMARQSCGIERDWQEDEDQYEGIDDANRHVEGSAVSQKPEGQTIKRVTDGSPKSYVFLNITRSYTDAFSARLGDMLLPTDDRSFSLEATPVPDQFGNVSQEDRFLPAGASPVAAQAQQVQAGQPSPAGYAPGGAPQPVGGPGLVEAPRTPLQDAIDQALKETRRKVKNCERQIDDWLTECNFHSQMRRSFDDAARMGTGVIKGPVPASRRKNSWTNGQLQQSNEVVPVSLTVDPWDCFPDMTAGENIKNGRYHFERARMTPKMVAALKDETLPVLDAAGNQALDPLTGEPMSEPAYFVDQIDKVLKEGPKAAAHPRTDLPTGVEDFKSQFEVWYGYATLNRDDLIAIGADIDEGDSPLVPVVATMINDCVVKIAQNPADTGEIPYDYFVPNRRKGLPFGRGIPRLIKAPQEMIVAATRNLMDNAGLSAGLILFLRRRGLHPVDNNWDLHGRKIFMVDDEVKSAQDAFGQVTIDSRQAELQAIIEMALNMAEQVTALPMLLQGQVGNAPDTLGGQQLAMNNANGALRRQAKLYDDQVTEPHITRYYNWSQQYSEDEDLKCDATVDARGSSTLVERHIADQAIAQMGSFVGDPSYGMSKVKWLEQWMKSQRLDPESMRMSDEEKQALQQQAPPTPYQIDVAKINAESKAQVEEIRGQNAKMAKEIEAQGRLMASLAEIAAEENLTSQEMRLRLFEVLNANRLKKEDVAEARDGKLADMITRHGETQSKQIGSGLSK